MGKDIRGVCYILVQKNSESRGYVFHECFFNRCYTCKERAFSKRDFCNGKSEKSLSIGGFSKTKAQAVLSKVVLFRMDV